MLVAPPRVGSQFLDGPLSDANPAFLDRPKSSDPVVEQMIEASAEAFGLLVSEIAEVERSVLKSPFEVRSRASRQCVIKCRSMALNYACKRP